MGEQDMVRSIMSTSTMKRGHGGREEPCMIPSHTITEFAKRIETNWKNMIKPGQSKMIRTSVEIALQRCSSSHSSSSSSPRWLVGLLARSIQLAMDEEDDFTGYPLENQKYYSKLGQQKKDVLAAEGVRSAWNQVFFVCRDDPLSFWFARSGGGGDKQRNSTTDISLFVLRMWRLHQYQRSLPPQLVPSYTGKPVHVHMNAQELA